MLTISTIANNNNNSNTNTTTTTTTTAAMAMMEKLAEAAKALTEGKVRIAIHNGVFHPDDVCSVALLRISGVQLPVVRTRDSAIVGAQDTLAIDVGEGEFDHHGKASGMVMSFSDGSEAPHCGLSKLMLKMDPCPEGGEITAATPVASAVAWVAAQDNGESAPFWAKPRFDFIHTFVPKWNEEKDMDEAFGEAVSMAEKVWIRILAEQEAEEDAESLLAGLEKVAGGKIVVMPCPGVPWHDWAQFPAQSELLYVISPSKEGTWYVQCVPPSAERWTEQRKSLPEEWRGKRGQELITVTGISDAVFCHAGGFIGGTGSLETALALARKAIEA